jgi:uncharacterized damage-inducible protein DinB
MLSWMPWRRRKAARKLQEAREEALRLEMQQEQERRLLHLLEAQTRALLLEALTPVAEAMRRQDQRQAETQASLEALAQESRALLIEVLQGQMPPLRDRIFQDLGQPQQLTSSRSSAS